nr:MAG TPA: hypothetical protein [Caudoviricetes sp.]
MFEGPRLGKSSLHRYPTGQNDFSKRGGTKNFHFSFLKKFKNSFFLFFCQYSP